MTEETDEVLEDGEQEEVERLSVKLTEKDKAWLRVYCKTRGNATEATRVVCGGTPLSCRVKGYKRRIRLSPVIDDILDRGFHRMRYGDMTGIDFYLGNMEREAEEERVFMESVGGMKGIMRLLKGPMRSQHG